MSHPIDALLEEAVGNWASDNPYAIVDLAHEYTSTGNPFLGLAEAKWFSAIRSDLPESVNDALEQAARQWAEVHPPDAPAIYSSTANRFLWAAESAFIAFLLAARARWDSRQPTVTIGPKKLPIPEALRWDIWERDNFTCHHCGARRYLAVDHILPESKGGTLDPSNLQTLCRTCNSRKGTS